MMEPELDNKKRKKRILKFMVAWIFLSFALFLRFYDAWVKDYNTTLLAISYKYGFTSRGLLGTIYQTLTACVGVETFSYETAMRFFELSTLLFFCLLAWFIYVSLKRTTESAVSNAEYLIFVYTIFTIPMFSSCFNYGRVDLYMTACSLLAVILLITRKAEWLVIPLTACGVMFHQGYVFMFYNIVLVLLLYRILTENQQRKKYIAIFVLSLVICCTLFLWFQVFFRGEGAQYFDEAVEHAKALGFVTYHEDLLRAELLGVDLTAEELKYRYYNIEDIICLAVLMSPFFYQMLLFLKDLIQSAKEWTGKFIYIAFAAGSLTMLPDYLFKVDFGRWVYATFTYYLVTMIALIAMGDKNSISCIKSLMQRIKKSPWAAMALVYPILFVPFNDIVISEVIDRTCIFTRGLLGI